VFGGFQCLEVLAVWGFWVFAGFGVLECLGILECLGVLGLGCFGVFGILGYLGGRANYQKHLPTTKLGI